MPLNYSKWDQLEVSSDLFVHCIDPLFETLPSSLTIQTSRVIPTSIKSLSFGEYASSYLSDVFFSLKSFACSWKQRDIHEKREIRKGKIKHLQAQIDCNKVLLPRIKEIYSNLVNQSLSVSATVYFNSLVEQLQTNPSPDCPPGADSTKLEHTYDGMVLSLLKMVSEKAKDKVKQADVVGAEKDARLAKELAVEVATHVQQLGDTIDKNQKELDEELKEQKKHITSEDLHEGFDSKVSRFCMF